MKNTIITGIILFLGLSLTGQSTPDEHQKIQDMKQPILGLRTVCYLVTDMEKAKEWYSEAFATKPYFDQPFYIGFNIGGYELGLQPLESGVKSGSAGILVYWGVENIEKEFARMIDLGAEIHEEPTNVGGDLMVASVKDPWGNVIGLIYNPEFKLPEK